MIFQVGLQSLLQRELLLHLFPRTVCAHAGYLHQGDDNVRHLYKVMIMLATYIKVDHAEDQDVACGCVIQDLIQDRVCNVGTSQEQRFNYILYCGGGGSTKLLSHSHHFSFPSKGLANKKLGI